MSTLEELILFDRSILYFINGRMANPLFDHIMPIIRSANTWIPLYILFFYLAVKWFKRNSWVIVVLALLTVTIADRSSAGIMKPSFERLRPCHKEGVKENITLRKEYCGGQFGFVSSHAANHFALAVFLISAFRGRLGGFWIFALLFWAALICFAQVYVGVHYPADVLFGGLLGCFIGYITGRLNRYILKSQYQENHEF